MLLTKLLNDNLKFIACIDFNIYAKDIFIKFLSEYFKIFENDILFLDSGEYYTKENFLKIFK